jgi:hypothetical protein
VLCEGFPPSSRALPQLSHTASGQQCHIKLKATTAVSYKRGPHYSHDCLNSNLGASIIRSDNVCIAFWSVKFQHADGLLDMQVWDAHKHLSRGMESGEVQPLPWTVYSRDHAQDAFRFLAGGAPATMPQHTPRSIPATSSTQPLLDKCSSVRCCLPGLHAQKGRRTCALTAVLAPISDVLHISSLFTTIFLMCRHPQLYPGCIVKVPQPTKIILMCH